MKNKLVVNLKKVFFVYFTGFGIAFFMPEKYFFVIMNLYHKRLNDNLLVIDKGDYYKII
jgi:hypothetical protein